MTIRQIIEKQLGDQLHFLDQDVLTQIFAVPIMDCEVDIVKQRYQIDPSMLRVEKDKAIEFAKEKLPERFLNDAAMRKYVKTDAEEVGGVVQISCEMMLLK